MQRIQKWKMRTSLLMLMQSWMLHQPFDVEARKCRKHRNCMECIGSLLFKPWLYISSDSNGVDSYLNSLEVKEFFLCTQVISLGLWAQIYQNLWVLLQTGVVYQGADWTAWLGHRCAADQSQWKGHNATTCMLTARMSTCAVAPNIL